MVQLSCAVVLVLLLMAALISVSDGAPGDWKNPTMSSTTRVGIIPQVIPENLPPGRQSPAFVAVEGATSYRIVSQSVDGLFVIQNNGSIDITSRLDYENVTSYTIVVEATDGCFNKTGTVTIKIEDKNDNRPTFPGAPYFFRLPDNSTEGTYVAKVAAIDEDRSFYQSKIEKYAIKPGRDADLFVIVPSSGEIYVAKDRSISSVTKVNYTFTVQATDIGSPTLTGSADVTVCVACPIINSGRSVASSLILIAVIIIMHTCRSVLNIA